MKKVSFITIKRLLEMKANNEKFSLVDVLSEESYAESHITDAINIPLEKLEKMAERYLDKPETIVVY